MGRNPNAPWRAGETYVVMRGTRTKSPQRPYTTDGTAASSSTTYVSGTRIDPGQSSATKIAITKLTGTPRTRATDAGNGAYVSDAAAVCATLSTAHRRKSTSAFPFASVIPLV